MPQSQDAPFVEQAANQRLRELGIEGLGSKHLERIVRSALHQYERKFCQVIAAKLSAQTRQELDQLLRPNSDGVVSKPSDNDAAVPLAGLPFQTLAAESSGAGLSHLPQEAEKLQLIRQLNIPSDLFSGVSTKLVTRYQRRAATEHQGELRRHPAAVRYTLLSAFYWQRGQEITDNLVDILLGIIHKLGSKAEHRVTQQLPREFKRVKGKTQLLYQIAQAALAHPEGTVREVIYPIAAPEILQSLVEELSSNGTTYRQQVHKVLRRSYLYHYRRMLPPLLELLEFRSNNTSYQPIIESLALLKKYANSPDRYFPSGENLGINTLKTPKH